MTSQPTTATAKQDRAPGTLSFGSAEEAEQHLESIGAVAPPVSVRAALRGAGPVRISEPDRFTVDEPAVLGWLELGDSGALEFTPSEAPR